MTSSSSAARPGSRTEGVGGSGRSRGPGVALRVGKRLVVPGVLIAVWVAVTTLGLVRPLFLPPPGDLLEAYKDMAPLLPRAILTTLGIVLGGFAIGTVVGTSLGLLMAYSARVREFMGSIFDFLRPVPIFALIPLFLLWFGVGRAPQITLVALGCSVILGVTTLEATRNVPSVYIGAALTLGASRRRIYRTVVLPWIFPHLIGAIRVAAAAAWGLDVAAEFMGSQEGLGYLIILQQTFLRTAGIFVLVIVYSLLAMTLDLLIARLESRLTRWTERRAGVGIVATIVGGR